MFRSPRVSVVVPFYNPGPFFQEAIDSVFAQTFSDWDLWLVDDAGGDGSTEIARQAARRHSSRVRYVDHLGHRNRGAAASRNLGIAHSSGRYIAFLDADDVWLPGKLEQQVAALDAHPGVGMACAPSQYWYSWTGNGEDGQRDFVPFMLEELGLAQDTILPPPHMLLSAYPLGTATAPGVCSLLIRRQVLQAVGGFEESFHGRFQLYEDQTLLTKIYRLTSVYVSGVWNDRYRRHPSSCESTVIGGGHYLEVRLRFLKWFQAYLRGHGVTDPAITGAVERALDGCEAVAGGEQR